MTRLMRWAALAALLAACPALAAEAPLKVFAAASLSESLQDVAALWAKAGHPKPIFNFHSSGSLARQIAEGAPADLFFTADEAAMDRLGKAGLLAKGSRRSLLSNSLAVVVPAEGGAAVDKPADLVAPHFGRLAIGDPSTVPVGAYARQWLQGLGLWKAVIDKAVPCDNVRAVLAAVESGNVDAGIVYRTDALVSKKVKVAYDLPRDQGPKISYPLAVLKDAADKEQAMGLAAYLAGPEAGAAFKARGFVLLDAGE